MWVQKGNNLNILMNIHQCQTHIHCSSHHTQSIIRLGAIWLDTVTNPICNWVGGPKCSNPIAHLGRRLESWLDTLAAGQAVRGSGHGQSHGFCGGGVKISNFCFQNFFRFEKNILHFFFLARRILSNLQATAPMFRQSLSDQVRQALSERATPIGCPTSFVGPGPTSFVGTGYSHWLSDELCQN